MTLDYVSHGEILIGVAGALLAFMAWLASSAWLHHRSLAAVPIRVHVAGSRGKTSTARLLGAGLRAAGLRVLVKTTGTVPLLILPDASEQKWRRWGPATIAEQTRFFRKAARLRADAVVLESMAIAPEYLWASEKYLVRATHVVITNVRPDHAEEFGHDADAMAQALALLVPASGKLVLTTEAAAEPILHRAGQRNSAVTIVNVDGLAPHESNTRLALEVCTGLGVDRDRAAAEMLNAGCDPGAFFACDVKNVDGCTMRFFNAFACNDPESFRALWLAHPAQGAVTVLLNCRPDRPARTRDFLEMLATLKPSVTLVMAGQWSPRWLKNCGWRKHQVLRLQATSPEKILVELASLSPQAHVWGAGNYDGVGEMLVQHVRQRSSAC